MAQILTIDSKETTHHTFTHVALAFLFLNYSCGIHNIEYKEEFAGGHGLGWLTVSSDGMLIFKAFVNRDWDSPGTLYLVRYFNGKKYETPSPPITLSEVKKMFIKALK
jgi:hypothetical protein